VEFWRFIPFVPSLTLLSTILSAFWMTFYSFNGRIKSQEKEEITGNLLKENHFQDVIKGLLKESGQDISGLSSNGARARSVSFFLIMTDRPYFYSEIVDA